jgi:hypothetical protein
MFNDLIFSFLKGPVLAGQVRHLVSMLAGVLVGVGALQSSQQNEFISIGVGIVMWFFAAVWSWAQKGGVVWLQSERARLEKLLAIYQKQATAQRESPVTTRGIEGMKQPPAPSVQEKP